MAPAAAELIAQNLTDFKRKPEDYDRIITGDLGEVGQQILFDLLLKKGMHILIPPFLRMKYSFPAQHRVQSPVLSVLH